MSAVDHEHYWVDAPDDEPGWFCTICRVTEHPGEGIHEDDVLADDDAAQLARAVLWLIAAAREDPR